MKKILLLSVLFLSACFDGEEAPKTVGEKRPKDIFKCSLVFQMQDATNCKSVFSFQYLILIKIYIV